MKRLVIKEFGPIREADMELRKINAIIGPQSSGKSCILKIACHCAWVEKRIEMASSESAFTEGDTFISGLLRFHKLGGYLRPGSFIGYESDRVKFSYGNSKFVFEWKDRSESYLRPKLSYVPAERNLVAVIPNWYEVKFSDNNIRSFMADWERARKEQVKGLNIMNLGVSYRYDQNSGSDRIDLTGAEGGSLDFTNASSGLQSFIPLYVHLNYLMGDGLNKFDMSIEDLNHITFDSSDLKEFRDRFNDYVNIHYYGHAPSMQDIYARLVKCDHCDIFIEEPEENLFPQTQYDMVCWLARRCNENARHSLFVATHSPYVMTSFNNLLQAGGVLESQPGKRAEVDAVLDAFCAIDPSAFCAYAVKDGLVHDIMDREYGLVSAEELDSVSARIGSQFEKLLDL